MLFLYLNVVTYVSCSYIIITINHSHTTIKFILTNQQLLKYDLDNRHETMKYSVCNKVETGHLFILNCFNILIYGTLPMSRYNIWFVI